MAFVDLASSRLTYMASGLTLSSTRGVQRLLRSPHSGVIVSRRAVSTASQQTGRSSVKTVAYASLFAVSTGLFAIYYFDCRAAIHKYVVTPVIRHTLDPEAGHKLAVRVLSSGLAPRDPLSDDEVLKTEVCACSVSEAGRGSSMRSCGERHCPAQ